MVAGPNKVFVSVDRKFQDRIDLGNGNVLFTEAAVEWMTEEYEGTDEGSITTHGIVRIIPDNITDAMKMPVKKNGKTRPYSDIQDRVKVGDKIHFRYISLLDEDGAKLINGEYLWAINYCDILAVEHSDGNLEMVGGWTFLEREYEDTVIIEKEFDGNKRLLKDRGRVVSIGRPLKGDSETGVKPGDLVVFRNKYDEVYEIRNKWLITVQQDDLLVVL